MRTKLGLIPLALAGVATAGCSLAFNGSHYQGGTRTDGGAGVDTGMPIDAAVSIDTGTPTDTGTPIDGGSCHDVLSCPAPGTYCDIVSMTCMSGCDENADCMGGGVCDTAGHTCGCARDADCALDSYCKASQCDRCDNDGDGYYAEGAPALRCSRTGHLNGGDCNDNNPQIYPFARPDCSTPVAESCPLPISFAPGGVHVTETGITATQAVFIDDATVHAARGPIAVFAGDDIPALPSGVAGGFVGFIGAEPDGSHRFARAVPLVLSGTPGTPDVLFDLFEIGMLSLARVRDGSNDLVTLSTVATPGSPNIGIRHGTIGHMSPSFGPEVSTGMPDIPLQGSGRVSVASMSSLGSASAVTPVISGGSTVFLAGTPIEARRSAAATVQPGTWTASAGSAVIWMASETQIGVWNGADTSVPPPTIDLSSYTMPTGSPVIITADFRGSIASRSMAGSEHFIAAIPIGSTARPPTGRIVLLRWSWPTPSSPTPVGTYIPSMVVISELVVGPHLNGFAGTAVTIIDDAQALVSYQEGGDLNVRIVPLDSTGSVLVENPPTLPMMHLSAGETYVGVSSDGGFYPDVAGGMTGVGRFVVAAMVEYGAMGGTHEIRVRALEGCVAP